MNMKKYVKRISAIAGICLIGATAFGCSNGISVEDHNLALEEQANQVAADMARMEELRAQDQASTADKLAQKDAERTALEANYQKQLSDKDKQILADVQEVAAEVAATEEAEVEVADSSYKLDDLELGASVTEELGEKELSLIDSKIDWDGDDYDVNEVVRLTAVEVAINKDEFKKNSYLVLPEESVSYSLLLDDQLDTSLITEDEPLELVFLGKEISITNWNGDEVTINEAITINLKEGEHYDYHGMDVSIYAIGEDYAYVMVGDKGAKVDENDLEEVNGIEIKVTDVLYQGYADGLKAVELDLGYEVERDIESGDEYVEDSQWEWRISANEIGIVLAEEYKDLDEDEEYQPLAYETSLMLPEEFVSLSYEVLDNVDYYAITLEEDEKSGNTYVEVKGEFSKGLEDYDRLYVNSTGIYDKDLELIDLDAVEIEDTELELERVGSKIRVGKFVLRQDFSWLKLDNVDVSSVDESMRAKYGTIVSEPEDSLDDKKVKLEVPEEQVYATIKLTK